jgi:hypothetical protein
MTSLENSGFLSRLLATLGRALKRGILGRASDDATKRLTENCAYWDRVIAASFAGAPEQSSPNVGSTARGSPEPEFEPVHAWTRRQLVDYLRRNPDYRPAYEAELHHRCRVRSVLSPGTAAEEGSEDSRAIPPSTSTPKARMKRFVPTVRGQALQHPFSGRKQE